MRREAAPFAISGPIVRPDGWKAGPGFSSPLASNQPRAHARLTGIIKRQCGRKGPLTIFAELIFLLILIGVGINVCADHQSKQLENVDIRYMGQGEWSDR